MPAPAHTMAGPVRPDPLLPIAGRARPFTAAPMTALVLHVDRDRVVWACFAEACIRSPLTRHGQLPCVDIEKLADGAWADMTSPATIVGCNMAGEAERRLLEEQMEIWDVLPRWVVARRDGHGLVNGYEHPCRLGADRWAAMVGAWNWSAAVRQLGGEALLVVMAGSVVTVDAVSPQGRFLGGVILAGRDAIERAVMSGTARVGELRGQVHDFPTNTSDGVASGSAFAVVGAIERMAGKLVRRFGSPPRCLLTGDDAGWLAAGLDIDCEFVDDLILRGLLQIAAG